MLQVDFVLTYAIGSTLAAAAARQIEKEGKPFSNRYFVYLVIFLSCLYAPFTIYFLWRFPHWQTMQVAATHADIPAWLVFVFAATNITQGVLGYWVSYRLIMKKKYYASHVNWMTSWLLFWFILVCGWDGTGWQRFLYDPTKFDGRLWTPGTYMGLDYLTSNVFLSIVVMGVILGPPFTYALVTWIREGLRSDSSVPENEVPSALMVTALTLGTIFVVCLGLGILASLLVIRIGDAFDSMWVGYLSGIPIFFFFSYYLLFRKRMPMYIIARQLFIREPGP
jgi:uncharacterized membrane protein (DUF2068 family)